MINSVLVGDSVAYGSIGLGRASPYPRQILNTSQSLFNFTSEVAIPGATTLDILQNPLYNSILNDNSIGAILYSIGGNDNTQTDALRSSFITRIKTLANNCILHDKLFCFVGIIDVNAKQSYEYQNIQGSIYDSGLLEATYSIAGKADILRQVCCIEGYPYVDVRNSVKVDLRNITSDIIHPTQDYYNKIFQQVAKEISG